MSDGPDRAELYAERAARFHSEAEALGQRSRLVSNLRGLMFAVFVLGSGFALFGHAGLAGALVGFAGLLVFVGLVAWHARVIDEEDLLRRWHSVNRDAELRVTDRWRELPETGANFADAAHPYSDDLDLFGPGSVFQRINVAHTRFGHRRLAESLQQPTDPETIRARQIAVRALAPNLELRQHLEALARGAEPHDKRKARGAPDPEALLRWAESPPELVKLPGIPVASKLLPLLTLVGLGLSSWAGFNVALWIVPLLGQLALTLATAQRAARVFTAVSSTEGAFLRYGAMFQLFERLELDSALLQSLSGALRSGNRSASDAMRAFKRAVGWFDLRHNGLVHPIANVVLLWDVNCVLALESWQRRWGNGLRGWFAALGELEALSSLAGLGYDEPQFVYPEIVESAPRFVAEGLGHPLIPRSRRVVNDVVLPGPGTALLVTGSNMSGKSTLLRAMGVAAVLANAGAPVCARELQTGRFAVCTSIRVRDSLDAGVSHFYAELRKLDAVVRAAAGPDPVLFLLDEILHGTNSRERQIGARWVLRELIERSAIGAVSTHDTELCRLEPQLMDRVQQVHFREDVDGDRMTFDYTLRPGPVMAGNALRLMRLVGLAVPLDEE